MKERFFDGIVNIGFAGGMVRIDLGTFSQGEAKEGEAPNIEPRERVILRPEGFLQALSAMQTMAKKLAENGVLRQVEASGNEGDDVPPTSVNFTS